MAEGTVFNIQHFSVHDGPGVRSTVFFKGCGLRCFWCHNPESFSAVPEIRFEAGRCIGCGACREACFSGEPEKIRFTEKCRLCGKCAESCFAGAIKTEGKRMTASEVAQEVLRDKTAYEASGGGVTLSGGEPLLQWHFAAEILSECRKSGVHTAIETACFVSRDALDAVIPLTDLFMCDIKAFDPKLHEKGTGQPNGRILENIEYISRSGADMILRTPVIPGFNDNEKEISDIARFISTLPQNHSLELLPFHGLSASKYSSLGKTYGAEGLKTPTTE
ncbi:MAG: glycyl-radical enzyme activating protein, partial [Clostridia bacterium]|nr:glycyl-radical enzyme activating protein [Clostridia bacterium]